MVVVEGARIQNHHLELLIPVIFMYMWDTHVSKFLFILLLLFCLLLQGSFPTEKLCWRKIKCYYSSILSIKMLWVIKWIYDNSQYRVIKHDCYQSYQTPKVANYFSQCWNIHTHRSQGYLRFTHSFVSWKEFSIKQTNKQGIFCPWCC